MFALLLRLKRHIKRLLKVQTQTRQAPMASLRARAIRVLLLVGASLAIGLLYRAEMLYDPLDMPHRGEFAREDIRAPFRITVQKSEQVLEQEREQLRNSTPFVLDCDTTVIDSVMQDLAAFTSAVTSFKRQDSTTRAATRDLVVDSLGRRFPNLSRSGITRALARGSESRTLRERLSRLLRDNIYQIGVMSTLEPLRESANPYVQVRRGDREVLEDRDQIHDLVMAGARLLTALNQEAAVDSLDVDLYYQVGRGFIRSNLTLNRDEFNRRVSERLDQISAVKTIVEPGDIIVSARQRVTADQEEILQELSRLRRDQANGQWWSAFLPALARLALVFAAFGALYAFLFYFRPDVFNSNPRLLAIFVVFGLQMFLIYLVDLLGLNTIYIYPVAILPVIITILFDSELGVLSTIVLALLLGVMHRFSFSLVLLTVAVGFVGSFTARRVRRRSHFYRIMLAVVLAYVLLILIVEKLRLTPNEEILTEMVYGLSISALSVLVITGILPVFESLFGITTDTTLLELSDLNHPLLKRLSIEAPGTYHHSISVGNLSEAAAEAIDANPLLARVGAYYHDIGKIEIPEYFVENQFSVRSRHDSLTPTMSALILSSHVKKGRLLGEEADIPDDVLNFIEEHHGTMVMTYFYNKAKEQGAEEIDIDKFRYPGPKPQTRETGIAMLADAVEAASRTLDEPKPARIDALLQRIINDRFQSGELDECPLTLRDLALIKSAFAQVLIAAFHHRVKYPAGPLA